MPQHASSCQAWESQRAALLRALLDWYEADRRPLPWRAPAIRADPWAILVSEFMLQQTTAAVVAQRFPAFLARFPDPQRLADATLAEVLHAWQGLGYYRRARYLHACARVLVERYGGKVPDSEEALRRLPGIGAYTAAAIAAIAFGRPTVPVDGNVARVLTRFFGLQKPQPKTSLSRLAHHFAAEDRAGDRAQALIELGARLCRPRRPSCHLCPLRSGCQAFASGKPELYGRANGPRERRRCQARAFIAVDGQNRILLGPRLGPGPLEGLFLPPMGAWHDASQEEAADEPPFVADWQPLPGEVRHLFTHIDLRVVVLRATASDAPAAATGAYWFAPHELAALALPSLTRKLLQHAGYPLPSSASGRQASGT